MSFTQLTPSPWRRGVGRGQRRYTFEFGISMPKHILGTMSKVMVPQICYPAGSEMTNASEAKRLITKQKPV